MERDEIQNYRCKFTNTKPSLSGRIDDPCWSEAPFTKDFIDIRGISFPSPKYQTQAKMLYDTEFLYIAAKLQEPQVWTDISLKNSVLYWQNDFEVFLNPLGDAQNYYELDISYLSCAMFSVFSFLCDVFRVLSDVFNHQKQDFVQKHQSQQEGATEEKETNNL